MQRGQIPAFYAEGTAYIFLCPAYFQQEKFPEKPHCPEVHNDRFAGDPNIFYKKYQVYTLVNQLLRFYLGDNALDAESDPMEQLDWNNCVFLLGSLVLFVARELLLLLVLLQLWILMILNSIRLDTDLDISSGSAGVYECAGSAASVVAGRGRWEGGCVEGLKRGES